MGLVIDLSRCHSPTQRPRSREANDAVASSAPSETCRRYSWLFLRHEGTCSLRTKTHNCTFTRGSLCDSESSRCHTVSMKSFNDRL